MAPFFMGDRDSTLLRILRIRVACLGTGLIRKRLLLAVSTFISSCFSCKFLPAFLFPLVFLCQIPLALLELVIGFGQGASL